MRLAEQKTVPVSRDAHALSRMETADLIREIPQWSLSDRAIEREFRFKDFRLAMDFVNRIAALAIEQDHHPDIFIAYNKVRVTLSTHKVGGLTLNDFIVAAKISLLADQLPIEKVA